MMKLDVSRREGVRLEAAVPEAVIMEASEDRAMFERLGPKGRL